ncbi:MAG: hypothetical protein MRK02_03580 [Candidatus Scalindua sp.]|nr:hypothetical protein [Candidatus Scalindua sp.]
MKLPDKTGLPFFAYGLFKPSQLCFFRIKDLVDSTCAAEVDGFLKERDGIPLLIRSSHSRIKGILMRFRDGCEIEAYKRIIGIEPDEVYRWEEVIVSDNVYANALVGRRQERGSSDLEHVEEWDARTDPFFKDAIEEIEAILKNNSQFQWDYKPLFRLQMAYTLLWSGLERYAGLRYHLGRNVNEKVFQIAKEEQFAQSLRKHVEGTRVVYSTVDLRKYTLDPNDPDESIRYYYQVRSNVVHRGKAVTRDFDIVKSSLQELLTIFKDLLNDAWNTDGR